MTTTGVPAGVRLRLDGPHVAVLSLGGRPAGLLSGQDRRTARAELVARCAELIRSRDHREAVRAFRERRAPRFRRA
ncbi:hypothetical protein [Pseudonocardia sp. NPDC046786]|uniref:hypothetical protein n=1 Tax=Pseudonocardia sp. NPDC046786 TaxID=3155471 RepID=UPI0033C292DA